MTGVTFLFERFAYTNYTAEELFYKILKNIGDIKQNNCFRINFGAILNYFIGKPAAKEVISFTCDETLYRLITYVLCAN